MERVVDKSLRLPMATVQLVTVRWDAAEQASPPFSGYLLCQSLAGADRTLRIGNLTAREALIRPNSVGLIPPGGHVPLQPVNRDFRALACDFDSEWFEAATGLVREQWDHGTGGMLVIRNRRLELLMQDLASELAQPGFAHAALVEATATMLVVELGRHARRMNEEAGCLAPGPRSQAHGLLPWQLRRIEERLAVALELGFPSLAELAALCGISPSHLMRTFKATTGGPICKYVAEQRIGAAKRMLLAEELNSKQIAQALGFRTPAYFATAFRRMTGKTPVEFRREGRPSPIA